MKNYFGTDLKILLNKKFNQELLEFITIFAVFNQRTIEILLT